MCPARYPGDTRGIPGLPQELAFAAAAVEWRASSLPRPPSPAEGAHSLGISIAKWKAGAPVFSELPRLVRFQLPEPTGATFVAETPLGLAGSSGRGGSAARCAVHAWRWARVTPELAGSAMRRGSTDMRPPMSVEGLVLQPSRLVGSLVNEVLHLPEVAL